MTENAPFLAPGCYGLGTIFNEKAKECVTCPFFAQCKPVAEKSLAMVREKYSVKSLPVKRAIVPTTAHPAPISMTLPKKVAELMQRLQKSGINVGESLRRKENPFPRDKHGFLRITSHMLLKLPVVKREYLQIAFESQLKWTHGTASAHVSQAIQLMLASGAVEEKDGGIALKS